MGKIRRPSPCVYLDAKGNEISDFGKGIEELASNQQEDAETQSELSKLFGEESMNQFNKPNVPLNEKGQPIDNRKITITNIRPSVPTNNNKG